MQLLLTAMRTDFPHLNRQPYGLDDAKRIAKKHGAKLKFAPYADRLKGYVCGDGRKKAIVINSDLGPVMQTFAALHEVTHVCMRHGVPTAREWLFCDRKGGQITKDDCDCNKFALIAMIPYPLLLELSVTEDLSDELIGLCLERRTIWERYGI